MGGSGTVLTVTEEDDASDVAAAAVSGVRNVHAVIAALAPLEHDIRAGLRLDPIFSGDPSEAVTRGMGIDWVDDALSGASVDESLGARGSHSHAAAASTVSSEWA